MSHAARRIEFDFSEATDETQAAEKGRKRSWRDSGPAACRRLLLAARGVHGHFGAVPNDLHDELVVSERQQDRAE
jgi:hypothetical protein